MKYGMSECKVPLISTLVILYDDGHSIVQSIYQAGWVKKINVMIKSEFYLKQ